MAEEEIRTQSENVTSLLETRDRAKWRYERITAALPVPMLTTDTHGRLRSANPAAAALFGLDADHLLRKPLFVFLENPDRQALRRTLSLARQGASPAPCSVTLRSRQRQVGVVAYVGPVSDDEVSWLLLEADHTEPRSLSDDEATVPDPAAELPAALLTLSSLSARGVEHTDVMHEAARVCAAALGDDAGVGIAVGHPLDPQSVATTSAAVQRLNGWQMRVRQAVDEGSKMFFKEPVLLGRQVYFGKPQAFVKAKVAHNRLFRAAKAAEQLFKATNKEAVLQWKGV